MQDVDWRGVGIIGWILAVAVIVLNVTQARQTRASYDDLLESYRAVAAQSDRSLAMLEEARAQNHELVGLVKFCIEGER